MGANGNFDDAKRFVPENSMTTTTMLWDPSARIPREYNVGHHVVIVLNSDLTEESEPLTGFNADWILNQLPQFT